MGTNKVGGALLAAAVLSTYYLTKKNEILLYSYDIESERIPDGFDNFRILHLSDLHGKSYGGGGEYLVRACEDAKPDIIVFTGDLYSRDEGLFGLRSKTELMKKLLTIAPVYYVMGNHEADVPEKAAFMNGRLAEEGINVLRNEKQRIYCGDEYINIYGLDLDRAHYKNGGGYKDLAPVTEELLRGSLGEAESGAFDLLLAHTPLPFEEYAKWGADLTLSGHIHGGMIRLPGGIGLLSPERKFFPKYSKGLYAKNMGGKTAFMEVSAGLGKLRINNPESISLCILKKPKNSNI